MIEFLHALQISAHIIMRPNSFINEKAKNLRIAQNELKSARNSSLIDIDKLLSKILKLSNELMASIGMSDRSEMQDFELSISEAINPPDGGRACMSRIGSSSDQSEFDEVEKALENLLKAAFNYSEVLQEQLKIGNEGVKELYEIVMEVKDDDY